MTKKLMIDDLTKSGLTERDQRNLKIKLINKAETKKLTNDKFNCNAYKIPYLDIDGKQTGFSGGVPVAPGAAKVWW